MRRLMVCWAIMLGIVADGRSEGTLKVGFGQADITPTVEPNGKVVWIAGYGMNRPAKGVHDPLFVRAFVFEDGKNTVAIAVVDLVGLQYPVIQRIREKLDGFNYVLISSTHQHEGPDVVGMWGEGPLKSGVDPKYIDLVVERTVEAIQHAKAHVEPAVARYGTAEDEEILRDSRIPYVKDGIIRVLQFQSPAGKNLGIFLQQNCHPESLASKNQYITADFNYFTIKNLEEKYQCPVAIYSGAVGGLMTLPGTIKTDDGQELHDGNFEYAEVYGNRLAKRTAEAIESSTATTLTPIVPSSVRCFLPMDNAVYKFGFRKKILDREAYVWTDDPWAEEMPVFDEETSMTKRAALSTEVCYIRLGDVHLAGIPGEAYPESVYGKFQEPAEPNADFPDAPLEKSVVDILPGEKFLFIGLANDELGYIIPKRQFDMAPPFAYGRKDKQYGEINSCGPEMAPILYEALERAVQQASK